MNEKIKAHPWRRFTQKCSGAFLWVWVITAAFVRRYIIDFLKNCAMPLTTSVDNWLENRVIHSYSHDSSKCSTFARHMNVTHRICKWLYSQIITSVDSRYRAYKTSHGNEPSSVQTALEMSMAMMCASGAGMLGRLAAVSGNTHNYPHHQCQCQDFHHRDVIRFQLKFSWFIFSFWLLAQLPFTYLCLTNCYANIQSHYVYIVGMSAPPKFAQPIS